MARQRSTVPPYQRHSSGRARVRTYDANGKRIEIILPGKYGSEASKAEYARILAQLAVGKGALSALKATTDCTIAELVLKFMEHASTYYVDPVTKETTNEVVACRAALRPLCRLYGQTPAAGFGPVALHSLRAAMITGSWRTEAERSNRRNVGLARTTCNRNIGRVKLLFKWGSSVELIPASVYHSLATVAGLRRGRSGARETEAVKPISAAIIDDTLQHLPPIVKDMVQLLLLTGMRCGEICIMRACDLDVTSEIWVYRPERHKALWRGKDRAIAIGPRAQAIIRKYLTMNTTAYLFRPSDQHEMIRAAKRAARKSPVQPSQQNRAKPNAKRRPGERFQVRAVNRAIGRACKRAGIELWHIHQLRHSASLNFSRELGLEAARSALGHSSVDMSAMYAGRDLEAAKAVASKLG